MTMEDLEVYLHELCEDPCKVREASSGCACARITDALAAAAEREWVLVEERDTARKSAKAWRQCAVRYTTRWVEADELARAARTALATVQASRGDGK